MTTTLAPPPDGGRIEETPFADALADRYLVYALSTITARSLPDLRDGLKPVHRRLLWAMRLLKLDPAQGYKKCARVVGDVIGKYHPHGDQSVYDALVRLAQTFALRYPLVDGQGNFGNVDGDNAAAMRYTEARLTAAAVELMDGLDEAAVTFRPTYNNEEEEPEVFPGLFPNLLANGAAGIAVGMATSIPPHNVAEVIDAACLLIADPDTGDEALMRVFHGPDFPTGGIVLEPASAIAQAYATGRGGFRLRARWEREELKNGLWQIVVTEMPYQVPKAKLIESIATLIADRRVPLLDDVRDESDAAIRLVLVPRSRNVDAGVLMAALFKLTDLEVRFPLNLNVLDAHRTPRVMGLKPLLTQWLAHQRTVLVARSEHRAVKVAERLETLSGLLVAYLNLDEVIAIIRAEDEPRPVLMQRFAISSAQATAILDMRLRSLRKLDEIAITRETGALTAEAAGLAALIADPQAQWARIAADLGELRRRYGPDTALGLRRTSIEDGTAAPAPAWDAMIEREPVTVILSAKDWVRAAKGHLDATAPETLRFKEGDGPAFVLPCQTTDRVIAAAGNGKLYTLVPDRLPGGRGFGEPLRLLIDLDPDARVVALLVAGLDARVVLVASDGRGFLARAADLTAETRKGRQVMTPRDGQRLAAVRAVPPAHDHLALIGTNRKLVILPLAAVPAMTRGQGVRLQRYLDGALADVTTLRLADGLSWPQASGGRTRTETDLTPWLTRPGASGRLPPQGFPRDNRFA